MRQIALWLCAVLASLTLAMSGTGAAAALPARPDGPVLDAAAIIPDADEAALDAKLRAYNRDTGRSVIVATVTSLDDEPVDAYAQKLAETWDIGGAESEQGVLFLIAPAERKIRIHTARGVQERLPDVLAGRIIRNTVAPRFKSGDMAGGINAGIEAIIAQLNRDPAEAKAVAEAAAAAEKARGNRDGVSGGAVVFWIMMILFFMLMFGRRRSRGYRRSGIDPGVILWGLSEIAHHASRGGSGGGGFDFGGSGGFGGFGGGGSGFDGGGASGDW